MDTAVGYGSSQASSIVSKLCDVVLNDLTQKQSMLYCELTIVPRLEVLLQLMGTQIYAANENDKKDDFVPISGEPSPVLSDVRSKILDSHRLRACTPMAKYE
mgnify:CR=1 FL=1